MSTEDDTELRDMLMQTLEKNGTLAKLRAQLRASVFLALEEQDKVKNKTPFLNEKLQKFNQSNDGRLCCELVIDLMRSLNLDAAESVFRPEINLKDIRSRDDLAKAVGVHINAEDSSQPLLALLLQNHRNQSSKTEEGKKLPDSYNKGLESTSKSNISNVINGKLPTQQNRSGKSTDFEDEQFRSVGDEDDFFGDTKTSSPAGFSTITQRTKSQEKDSGLSKAPAISSANSFEKKQANSAFDSINPKLSGSGNTLSLLGDLPDLSGGSRKSGLPPLGVGGLVDSTKRSESNAAKQQNLMKILGGGDGGSFEDFENDSPRISDNGSPKSPEPNKDIASRPKLGHIGKTGKQDESPTASKDKKPTDLFSRKRSENEDDEISEEIVEDLDVDDLLSSARSEQRSF